MRHYLNATADLDARGAPRHQPFAGLPSPEEPDTAHRAISAIRQKVKLLTSHPETGRPREDIAERSGARTPIERGAVSLYGLDAGTYRITVAFVVALS